MEQLSYLEIDGKQLEIADESARSTADTAINTANTAKSTADSANNVAGSAKSTAETAIDAAETAAAIAKGRNQAHVFNTTDAMKSWLSDANNKGIYNKGDNIYIVDVGVPDWWVSEVLQDADIETGYYYKIAQLETQKVDLTEINAEISQINSSLIDIYVGDDGKLHKVKGGADTVLPFNGVKYLGQFTRDHWYNENGFIIRDVYENYKNITIDNIIVFPVSCGFYFANPHTAGGPYNIEFTYNNDTGVITDSMIGMPTQASMGIEVAKIYIIE